ncbi:MAG: TRAP transporter substrate-binding protein DctP [Deltaproteobacteria bacterium]|nr:TRAP transporter substrate-binding protein DctP [Candidatus Tharpella sp.]
MKLAKKSYCFGFLFLSLVFLLHCFAVVDVAEAKRPKYLFKVASLAPEGSIWAQRFNQFAQEVKEKSGGEVGFRVYPGGVMGDDRSMFRKIKIGQLQGAGFTMTGIGEIVPDFRVMGIPYIFQSYDEVDEVLGKLVPRYVEAFAEKNLALVAMTEVGFIYTMSTVSISTIEDLRKCKCWAPEGDPVSIDFMKAVGISPVPLSLPDVLVSLQTGMVNTVFNGYYGSIILQWFTKIKYITDAPFAYAYGSLVFDKKALDRLPEGHLAIMRAAAGKYFSGKLKDDTRRTNVEALKTLKVNGISVVPVDPAAKPILIKLRDQVVAKSGGKYFSTEIYNEMMLILENYRKSHPCDHTE